MTLEEILRLARDESGDDVAASVDGWADLEKDAQEFGIDPEAWDAEVVRVMEFEATPEEKGELLRRYIDHQAEQAGDPKLAV